ncbi:uncharacterized protein PV09_03189 [Verruconis gallopava]|uniref:Uncharacterized protein n=1 Tax=Verruconis gallopava TaxID=253628 RepID=A0A0D2AGG9_9PEZI|nr:uncharacterized protein PV09_03189 [Verruconis gallopava]KIW06008.1 hypothetical protein PV09_03189 [Verruconis gallopava]
MTETARVSTFALPVDYDELVPALKAYAIVRQNVTNMFPTDHLKRADYFHGIWTAQMFDEVVEQMSLQIKIQTKEWNRFKMCKDGKCDRLFHLDEAEQERIRADVANTLGVPYNERDPGFLQLVEQHMDAYDPNQLMELHQLNVHSYYDYAVWSNKYDRDKIFENSAQSALWAARTLESDIGLRILVTTQIVTEDIAKIFPQLGVSYQPRWWFGKFNADFRPKAVLPFFTLLHARKMQGVSTKTSFIDAPNAVGHSNSLTFFDILDTPPKLDQKTELHFKRTLDMLHLKPYVDMTLLPSLLAIRGQNSNRAERAKDEILAGNVSNKALEDVMSLIEEMRDSTWPKYMTLTFVVNAFPCVH